MANTLPPAQLTSEQRFLAILPILTPSSPMTTQTAFSALQLFCCPNVFPIARNDWVTTTHQRVIYTFWYNTRGMVGGYWNLAPPWYYGDRRFLRGLLEESKWIVKVNKCEGRFWEGERWFVSVGVGEWERGAKGGGGGDGGEGDYGLGNWGKFWFEVTGKMVEECGRWIEGTQYEKIRCAKEGDGKRREHGGHWVLWVWDKVEEVGNSMDGIEDGEVIKWEESADGEGSIL